MPISNIQKVTPLSSLSVLMTGTTFSYVVTASEDNFFFILSADLAMQVLGPGWALSSWLKINKQGGGVAIRMSWHTFFEKN